jgi:hypothetical protein
MERIKRGGLFLLAAAIILVILPSGYCQQAKTYKNKMFNYSINYPSNYELKPLGNIVVFTSPEKDKKFAFSANVNVAASVTDKTSKSLKEYCEGAKARILKSQVDAKFLEEQEDKLSGKAAYRMVYTTKQKEANFKIMEIAFIHKDRFYVITYTSLLEEFDRYLKQAKAIIDSFKVSQ